MTKKHGRETEAAYDADGKTIFDGMTRFSEELGYKAVLLRQLLVVNEIGSDALTPPASRNLLAFSMAIDILEVCLMPYVKDWQMDKTTYNCDFFNANPSNQKIIYYKSLERLANCMRQLKLMGVLLPEIGDSVI